MWAASAALTLVLSGCATVARGSLQDVGIASYPSGASVSVDGRPVGRTPTVVHLARNQKHLINVALEGHVTAQVQTKRSASRWVLLELLLFLPLGVIDVASGSWYVISPDEIVVDLAPTPPTP